MEMPNSFGKIGKVYGVKKPYFLTFCHQAPTASRDYSDQIYTHLSSVCATHLGLPSVCRSGNSFLIQSN